MKTKKGLKLRALGNEYILIGEGVEAIDFNKMITMNESAAYLWNAVCDGRDFDDKDLAELLLKEYEVGENEAVRDAKATYNAWKEAEIIA